MAALPPLAANHSASCLPFLQGQGCVKDRKGVSERLFSVSLLDFLAQSNFVMDWTCFCSASRTTLDQVEKKAHQQNQKAFFQHMRERCLVLFFSKILLNGTDLYLFTAFKGLYLFTAFFPLVSSPSVYWLLLSELREIVRHKPLSMVIRKGAMLSA